MKVQTCWLYIKSGRCPSRLISMRDGGERASDVTRRLPAHAQTRKASGFPTFSLFTQCAAARNTLRLSCQRRSSSYMSSDKPGQVAIDAPAKCGIASEQSQSRYHLATRRHLRAYLNLRLSSYDLDSRVRRNTQQPSLVRIPRPKMLN